MTKMLKGEIIFEWKRVHPERVDMACLIINHTDTNPKYEQLHTFSFPIDKEAKDEDAYTYYFRNFINNWSGDLGIFSSNPFMGFEIAYREFGGEYKFRVYRDIDTDLKEMANSLWTPFIRDLCKHLTKYKTESVQLNISLPIVYSKKEEMVEKFTVNIQYNYLLKTEGIPIKGKPLSYPEARNTLAAIAEENWPWEYKEEATDSIRYVRKDLEPLTLIVMKGRIRTSSTFVKDLIEKYKEFGKNPKKFLDLYKSKGGGLIDLGRMMKSG